MKESKKTILIVDDDIDYLSQLEMQVRGLGYDVITAESQKEGEKVVSGTRPDLAIVDLMMEHMDGGFALSYRLKKLKPPVPVIMVTGVAAETGLDFSTTSEAERAWVKADAMLSKPVRFEQLQREIDRLLRS
jgi:CheY-like chemotaxis protein